MSKDLFFEDRNEPSREVVLEAENKALKARIEELEEENDSLSVELCECQELCELLKAKQAKMEEVQSRWDMLHYRVTNIIHQQLEQRRIERGGPYFLEKEIDEMIEAALLEEDQSNP